MNRLLFLCLAVAVAARTAAAADVARVVTRVFDAPADAVFSLETYAGAIRVEPGPPGAVRVEIRETAAAATPAEAEALLQKLILLAGRHGRTLDLTVRYPGVREGVWAKLFHTRQSPVQLEFTVTAPRQCSLELRTYAGGITVGDFDGEVRARSNDGALNLGAIGGVVRARTAGGPIVITSCAGRAALSTYGGSITAGRLAEPATLATSGGGIAIGAADSTVQARTAGGPIRVTFTGPLRGDCQLLTSGGDIDVALPAGSRFALDAKTSGGRVFSAFPVTAVEGEPDGSKLVGVVGGGGDRLKLRSAGGSIRLSVAAPAR